MNIQLIAYSLLFIGALCLTGRLLWHCSHMNQNLIGKYSGFLGLFCLFMPNQFNQVGNHHRVRVLILIPILGLIFLLLLLLQSYLGVGK
jgi:hypothetical protein